MARSTGICASRNQCDYAPISPFTIDDTSQRRRRKQSKGSETERPEFEAEPRINHFQPWKASFRREVPASSATLQDAGPWIMEVDDAID